MPYAVIIDNIPGRGEDPDLPKAVAHNLSRDAAERKQNEFRSLASVGVATAIWEYDALHPADGAEGCPECDEIVLEHCRQMLKLGQQEAAKRGQQILETNMRDKQGGQG
jgi:hypothetical protein